MAIEHDFFGVVEDDGTGGVRWADTVEVADQPVEVTLHGAAAPAPAALDLAAALVRSLDGFDARARDALVAQLSERGSATTRYVDGRVDALGEDLVELLVHTSGDVAMDVLRSLRLVRATLDVDAEEADEPFAVLEYAIDPDEDDVLSVAFDRRADVVAIEL